MKKKRHIEAKKEVYIVATLRSVAWRLYKDAEENIKSSNLKCIGSIAFSAFTLEAYLNYVGENRIKFWNIVEKKLSPDEKLDLISMELKIDIDKGKRPFQSFGEIFKFRRYIVHGRSEIITDKGIQTLSENEYPILPDTEWQRMVSLEKTKIYLDDTKKMVEVLYEGSELDFDPFYMAEIADWWASDVQEDKDDNR